MCNSGNSATQLYSGDAVLDYDLKLDSQILSVIGKNLKDALPSGKSLNEFSFYFDHSPLTYSSGIGIIVRKESESSSFRTDSMKVRPIPKESLDLDQTRLLVLTHKTFAAATIDLQNGIELVELFKFVDMPTS
jgi:hypothetical protein